MEQDRSDLVTAIIKLKDSISELNEKGRERLKEIDNEWFCAYQKKEISIKDFW